MSKYKGELEGFPKEIVEKMLERQVEQGNKRDVSVFEKVIAEDGYDGGFDWYLTIEGDYFWENVLMGEDFELFFKKYPRK